jgi:two-component system sensor histidine kinase VicK
MARSHTFRFLDRLAQQSHQVIFSYQVPDNQFTFVNAAFEQIWEIPMQELLQDPLLAIASVHPDDLSFLQENYQELISGTIERKEVEFRIILSDHAMKWIALQAFFMQDEEGNPAIAGYAEDISGRKIYIETMMKFSSKKNSILEILSHDLSGPIGTVKALATMLNKKIQPYQNEQLNEIVRIIESTCGRNLKLIRDFLHNEYLESTQVELNKSRLNLVEKISDIVDEYRYVQSNISKTFHLFTSHKEITVEVDEVKFIQVINNLISNSIKFTSNDGIIVTRIEELEDSIVITVADNGIGIPVALQPVLFDRFTKARRPGLHGEETVGLGLSIVKTIVELHDGKVWVESEENKGTTFFIQIPKE